jgi:hypothetical protein
MSGSARTKETKSMRRSLLIWPSLLALTAAGCDGSIGGAGTKDDSGITDDNDGDGYTGVDDCDDTNPDINIGAAEICDGLDNDCDAKVDANDDSLTDGLTLYPDLDFDGYGDNSAPILSCEPTSGYVETGDDCNDSNADIHPDAIETCGTGDDDGCFDFFADGDSDGFGADDAATACLCFGTEDFPTQEVGDCDDSEATINPEAEEICSDGIDQDCDGDWDECRISSPGPIDALAVPVAGLNDNSNVGTVISAGPDVNNDAVSDLAISVPGDDQAFVYTTAPTSSTTLLTADIKVEAASSATLGLVKLVPDVSGDGKGDLVGHATSPFEGYPQIAIWQTPSGTVDALDAELLYTDTSASIHVDDLFAVQESAAVATVFAVDLTDQVLRIYSGAGTGEHPHADGLVGTITTDASNGSTSISDLDGDGYDELAILHSATVSGSVDILLSASVLTASANTDRDWSLAGEDLGDLFGTSAASAGDLNDDGYGDLVIGAPNHDDVAANTGAAYIFYGASTLAGAMTGADADGEFAGELRNDYAGTSVSGIGDIDGDGNLDLGIGAPGFDYGDMDNPGAAYAVYGPFSGQVSLNDVRSRVGGSNADGGLGTTIVGPADLDGDGFHDFIVGEPGYDTVADTAAGAVWVFWGKGL